MNKYQYLLLDLDNTLYSKDSGMLKAIDLRIDDYIKKYINISNDQVSKLREEYWKKYGTTLGGLMIHYGVDPNHYFEYAYHINPADYICSDSLLRELLGNIDLVKVVFSNSPREYISRVLKVLGIEELIAEIYDIRFVNFRGKPNVESYQKVIADLQCEPESCIMVEDTFVNAVGAKRIGMNSVLLGSREDSGVDWVIQDIYQLSALMSGIIEKSRTA